MANNWEQHDWPNFRYDLSGLQDSLLPLAERTGRASGLLQGLTSDAQVEATVMIMVAEALKTSAIEGELLSRKDVKSSIRKNLGLETGFPSGDKRAQGAAALMLAVRNTIESPLSEYLLCAWHRTVMAGHRHVATGQWRTARSQCKSWRVHTDMKKSISRPRLPLAFQARWRGSSTGSTRQLPAGGKPFRKPRCAQPSHTCISNRSILSKTAMVGSAEPFPRRPFRKDSVAPDRFIGLDSFSLVR